MKVIQAFGDITVTLIARKIDVPDDATEEEIQTACRGVLQEEWEWLSDSFMETDSRGFSSITYTVEED